MLRSKTLAALLVVLAGPVAAQEGAIAWFGSWEAGLEEARRTGRPILLQAAAPTCHEVPGIW